MSITTVPADTVLRKQAARRNVSSDTILLVACKIIDEQGLSGAQARPIAEASGCSVGTLYNVFESLDTLILRVNARTLSDFRTQAREALDRSDDAGDTPIDKLISLANSYVDFAENNKLRWSAVFEFRRPPDDEVPDWYLDEVNGLFALVEESITDFPGDIAQNERLDLARALWASVHGIVSLAFAGRIGPIVAANVRQHVEIMIRAMWTGFVATARPAQAE